MLKACTCGPSTRHAHVPVVLGLLWGAPLVAHELEARTSDFAWTQSVTRMRWLTAKAGALLLAAAACGGVTAALITWWSGPINAKFASAFTPGQFDTQGIVPIGYALFAMALGIAAGTAARRTLPATAVVLGGFIGLRLVISNFLRPHYMAAITTYYHVTGSFTPPGQAGNPRSGTFTPPGQAGTLQHPHSHGDRTLGQVERRGQLGARLLRRVTDEQPAQEFAERGRSPLPRRPEADLLGVTAKLIHNVSNVQTVLNYRWLVNPTQGAKKLRVSPQDSPEAPGRPARQT